MVKLPTLAGFLVVLVVASASVFASAAGATHGQPGKPLPFHATIDGATTSMVVAPDPFLGSLFGGRCTVPSAWVISFAGTGKATHLGPFTWESSHCTQLGASPPATVTISDSRFTYVADNGDKLYETYGNAVVSFPTPEIMCMDTTATFTGGTGRFSSASGSALEHLCFPATSGPWLGEMHITSHGTIAYDASDRAG